MPTRRSRARQQVNLPTPIPIEADTIYIASYHTNGGWSYDSQYFLSDYSPAPLTAPASGAVGGNGVFAYGPAGSFPNGTFNANNYWVDVVFTAGTGGPNTPPSITSAAAFTIAENQTAVGTVTATDPDAGDTLSYAIAGGRDCGQVHHQRDHRRAGLRGGAGLRGRRSTRAATTSTT